MRGTLGGGDSPTPSLLRNAILFQPQMPRARHSGKKNVSQRRELDPNDGRQMEPHSVPLVARIVVSSHQSATVGFDWRIRIFYGLGTA